MRLRFILMFACAAAGLVTLRAGSPVKFSAATDREIYRSDAGNVVYVNARLRLAEEKQTPASHGACNIAFVLDRSGSMEGAPLQEMGKALTAAGRLLSPEDIVSVVIFGSEVETIVDATTLSQAGDLGLRMATVEAVGGSSLYDALNQGAAQLRRNAAKGRASHLIVVTDGAPTKGPRETDDFLKLAQSFSKEGITVSTIGTGMDFNEDMLANLARFGGGFFQYAPVPVDLVPAITREIEAVRHPVGFDAEVTVLFNRSCDKAEAHGWQAAGVAENVVRFRVPYFCAGRDINVLASASFASDARLGDVATVTARWLDGAEQRPQEMAATLNVDQSGEMRFVRGSGNPDVLRRAVEVVFSDGLQTAIEMLDTGDPRKAMGALRRARDETRSINDELEDATISARIREFDAYVSDLQKRGLAKADRKVLRSGLLGKFEIPVKDEEPK